MKHALKALLSITVCSQALADTWTVDVNGTADFVTIQEAIDVASDYDQIFVMPGTYTGNADAVVNFYGKAIWLSSTQGADLTVIDGEGQRRGVLCNSGETNDTRLEGFTITRGKEYDGGGMYLYLSSAMVISCKFVQNTQSTLGSGVCCLGGYLILSDCEFENNESYTMGGALVQSGGGIQIAYCSFLNNTSHDAGAVYLTGTDATVRNCMFESNVAEVVSGVGGAMKIRSTEGILKSSTFQENMAAYGGAIYYENATMTMRHLLIQNNEATSLGGGIETLGTLPEISFSEICGNSMDQINGGWTDGGGNAIADQCALPCSADLNGDNSVDIVDLLEVLAAWNMTNSSSDINTDGIVNVLDLLELIAAWGPCP